MRILTQSLQKSTALLIRLEERMLMLLVTNQCRMMQVKSMSMSKASMQKAWLEHCQRHLNVEFDWDPDHLSDEPATFASGRPAHPNHH